MNQDDITAVVMQCRCLRTVWCLWAGDVSESSRVLFLFQRRSSVTREDFASLFPRLPRWSNAGLQGDGSPRPGAFPDAGATFPPCCNREALPCRCGPSANPLAAERPRPEPQLSDRSVKRDCSLCQSHALSLGFEEAAAAKNGAEGGTLTQPTA